MSRRFITTSEDTGHVGQPGHDSERTWTRFNTKYHESCIDFLHRLYPYWTDDAEDCFQEVMLMIMNNPFITKRGDNDTFRTVLCHLCSKAMLRLHNPTREAAKKKFLDNPKYVLKALLHPSQIVVDDEERNTLKQLCAYIRKDMISPNYENGRYFKFLNERKFDLWRQIELSGTLNISEISRRLGIDRKTLSRAKREIDTFIFDEAVKLGKSLHVID